MLITFPKYALLGPNARSGPNARLSRAYRDDDVTPPAEPPPAPPQAPPPPAPSRTASGKLFTQEEVNGYLAKELATYKEKERKIQEQLTTLSQQAMNTEEEKKTWREKVEALNNMVLTKEQQAQKEREQLQKEAEAKQRQVEKDAETWKNRFTDSLITNGILSAASEHGAYKAQQFIPILKDRARLVETTDAEGQPTGNFEVKIKWDAVDKDGRALKIDLSPKDTVKAMRQQEDFMNLFVAEGGGTGYVPTRGTQTPGTVDPSKMSADEWINGGGRNRVMKKG